MQSTDKQRIAVYGASGHTGRFVVRQLQGMKLPVVAVGRDRGRLHERFSAEVPVREADAGDPVALRRAFDDCALVINCAGPFLDTAPGVLRACLDVRAHYIDVTAEQPSALSTFLMFDQAARAREVAVVPAAGFYGGLADLLATSLIGSETVDELNVAVWLDRWWPTEGTRLTGARNIAQRFEVADGVLQPLATSVPPASWKFTNQSEAQPMVRLPFSEVITLARHLRAGSIRSFLNESALKDVRDPATPKPSSVDAIGRSAQRFEMAVEVGSAGTTRRLAARGQDIYAVTAPIVAEAAARILHPSFSRHGTLALGEALDAGSLLAALDGSHLHVLRSDAAGGGLVRQ